MPRRTLPQYLCIDEKYFEGDTDGKYCVVLSDFFSGEIIDVLENRQMPYLDEYFKNISSKERDNVKVFISDMYDGYSTIKNKYFSRAMFVINLFHVVKLLTNALNKIRIRTYNQFAQDGTIERHFLKTNWRFFLMDLYKIRKNEYYSRKFDLYISYDEIILRLSFFVMAILFFKKCFIMINMKHILKQKNSLIELFLNYMLPMMNSYTKLLIHIRNGKSELLMD